MGGTKIIQPSVTIALANADREVGNDPQKVLLVGQKSDGSITAFPGSVGAPSLTENIASSGAPEDVLFGKTSMLASMVRAFKRVNKVTQVDCLALQDKTGGVRQERSITFAGQATAPGTCTVVMGSEKTAKLVVPVPAGSSSASLVSLIVTANNALIPGKDFFLYTGAAQARVDIHAVHKGTAYHNIPFGVDLDVPGMTISVDINEVTPGSVDPATTGIFDIVGSNRYQTIVFPYAGATEMTDLKTFLDDRFNPTNAILDGVGIVGHTADYNGVITLACLHNSQSVVLLCDKLESEAHYVGPAIMEPDFIKATTVAAIRSLRLTKDASISQYLTSSASLDQFGGTALASMPYFNTPVPQMPIIATGRGWTEIEIEQFLAAGVSVMGVNPSGDGMLLGEMATTYLTDPASNPDPTWTFLNYVDTASNAREYFWNNLRKRFAQSRLTEGSVARGRGMANAVLIRAYCEKLYLDISGVDFVLTQDGEAAIQYFKDNLNITLDLAEGKVTITMLVPIVTQLRQIIATMKVSFSTEG